MDAVLFEQETRRILLRCWEWKVISTLFPSDAASLNANDYEDLLASASGHYHTYRQILFFIRGTGVVTLNGQVYPASPGTVVFIDALEPHGERSLVDTDTVTYLRVNLRLGQFSARVFHLEGTFQTGASSGECLLPVTHESVPLEKQWSDLCARRELSSVLIRARLLATTMLLIASILDDSIPLAISSDSYSKNEPISAIAEHLRQTSGRGAKIRALAQASGYGVCHFMRLFKERTGVSVHHYIDQCRVDRFRQMTREGHSKKQIAVALGFATPSAFSHWLRSPSTQHLLSIENDWSSCL